MLMGHNPPGSIVYGNSQARILEWVAISSPGDLPDLGMEPEFLTSPAGSLPLVPPEKPNLGLISGPGILHTPWGN